MHVMQVVENIDDSYGGPARSIPELCEALHDGYQVQSDIISVNNGVANHNSLIAEYQIPWYWSAITSPKRYYYSRGLKSLLEKRLLASKPQLIHVHSIWTYPTYCALSFARRHHIPYIVSPRSSLYPQSLLKSRLVKQLVLTLYLKKYLNQAALFHATDKSELEAIRTLGYANPVGVVPNGVNVAEFDTMPSATSAKRQLKLDTQQNYILYLSRIHPRKNLDKLVDSWVTLAERFKNWDLLICGSETEAQSYVNLIRSKIEQHNLSHRAHFLGFMTGKNRLFAYAACDFFVLPSQFENFGMSIAEAMAAGKPVLVSTGTPWPTVQAQQAGWWIDCTAENLTKTLEDALRCSPETLAAMGSRAKTLISSYQWSAQAQKMYALYEWLLTGTSPNLPFLYR